jgi:hypothetical protein
MRKGVIFHAIFRPADMPKNEALAKSCFFPLVELYYKHSVGEANTARLGLQHATRVIGNYIDGCRRGQYSPFGIATVEKQHCSQCKRGRRGQYSPFGIATTEMI